MLSTIEYNTIQYNTIQYNTIQSSAIQYNTIQYNTIQYNKLCANTQTRSIVAYASDADGDGKFELFAHAVTTSGAQGVPTTV